MPSGGTRVGTPGENYPNRSDMRQPKQAPVGGEYGERKRLMDAQKVVALPQGGSSPERIPADDTRGMVPGLGDPSANLDEPLTAGLPMGPGAGPDALMTGHLPNMELRILKAVFQRHPNEDLRRIIEFRERNYGV